jgi:CheY-like chemotaxis protein
MTNQGGEQKMIKILLVEDNADHAELTKMALKERDNTHNIFWVKDGEEALDFIYHRNVYQDKDKYPFPDYILLDIRMPKIDGFEVLETLKTDPRCKGIPVIMLTTSDYQAEIKKSYELGANSFITKASGPGEFIEKIKDLEFYWTKTNSLHSRND